MGAVRVPSELRLKGEAPVLTLLPARSCVVLYVCGWAGGAMTPPRVSACGYPLRGVMMMMMIYANSVDKIPRSLFRVLLPCQYVERWEERV